MSDLGIYHDLIEATRKNAQKPPVAPPGDQTRKKLLDCLGFSQNPLATEVRIDRRWTRDGIDGELVSWSVGYGPRTESYVLKPAGAAHPLPAVVALHCHSGFKWFGKEKIADGPEPIPAWLQPLRDQIYGGVAWANELARRGFLVIVPDTFCWGSRRFPWEEMSEGIRDAATKNPWSGPEPLEVRQYHAATVLHEHLVEKYCRVLGTTMSGLISFEDRVAVNYLLSRDDVRADSIGCCGLSGGGLRAALLNATCDHINAAVIVGMMSTYDGMLDTNIKMHTWMLFPGDWPRHGDWSDVAACRAPSPLMVQYDENDPLFSPHGMQAAHQRIQSHYAPANTYTGKFYPGPHKFDLPMQADAFDWLARHCDARHS